MTDQPYTPTTEEIRDYVEMGGEPRPWEPPTPEGEALEIKRREAFDRWLAAHDAAIEAAAEQRGAVKALRDAATAIEKNDIVFDGDHYQPCNCCMSIHMNWLDYRADRIANKENE